MIITTPIKFNIPLNNIDATLKQRWYNVVQNCFYVAQPCFDIVLTSSTDVVTNLCNVENPPSDIVLFSTSDQPYFNVDLQRWNNIDPTLRCLLGFETVSSSVRFFLREL